LLRFLNDASPLCINVIKIPDYDLVLAIKREIETLGAYKLQFLADEGSLMEITPMGSTIVAAKEQLRAKKRRERQGVQYLHPSCIAYAKMGKAI
jgi:hypothetical protein